MHDLDTTLLAMKVLRKMAVQVGMVYMCNNYVHSQVEMVYMCNNICPLASEYGLHV